VGWVETGPRRVPCAQPLGECHVKRGIAPSAGLWCPPGSRGVGRVGRGAGRSIHARFCHGALPDRSELRGRRVTSLYTLGRGARAKNLWSACGRAYAASSSAFRPAGGCVTVRAATGRRRAPHSGRWCRSGFPASRSGQGREEPLPNSRQGRSSEAIHATAIKTLARDLSGAAVRFSIENCRSIVWDQQAGAGDSNVRELEPHQRMAHV
jgi:hypothetical protein